MGKVFALEAIIKWVSSFHLEDEDEDEYERNIANTTTSPRDEPSSGLLITFIQFVLAAFTGFYQHFNPRNAPFFVEKNKLPWMFLFSYAMIFFTVNMMNNIAFNFKISVPVHIILRSGGSVTTMAVGWLWGRTYSRMQVISVGLLTIGVVMAAFADAHAKVLSLSKAFAVLRLSLPGFCENNFVSANHNSPF